MPATPVNLYVDRLMPNAPNTAEEVWNATQEHPKIFAQAASRVGLTGAEYGEFQQALLDGKAIYIRLPTHLDAMSGIHHGRPYAIKSVAIPEKTLGWKVALEDGTVVYIPQVCGNLSIVHGTAVAHTKKPTQVAQRPRVVTQGSSTTPSTPVTFQPPADASTAYAPSTGPVSSAPVYSQPVYSQPVYSPPAYVPPVSHGSVLPFLVPIIAFVGSTVGAVSSPPTTIVPPCSGGSNILGVCQAGR
jgi:hypothetical protein